SSSTRGRPCVPASSMLTVRPLTFGTSRGLTPAGRVLLPYGGSFSKGAIVVICAGAAADPSTGSGRDAIATPPIADAPARNSRLASPVAAVLVMTTPCTSPRREGNASGSLAQDLRLLDCRVGWPSSSRMTLILPSLSRKHFLTPDTLSTPCSRSCSRRSSLVISCDRRLR